MGYGVHSFEHIEHIVPPDQTKNMPTVVAPTFIKKIVWAGDWTWDSPEIPLKLIITKKKTSKVN